MPTIRERVENSIVYWRKGPPGLEEIITILEEFDVRLTALEQNKGEEGEGV